jgi:hypothetical protein
MCLTGIPMHQHVAARPAGDEIERAPVAAVSERISRSTHRLCEARPWSPATKLSRMEFIWHSEEATAPTRKRDGSHATKVTQAGVSQSRGVDGCTLG